MTTPISRHIVRYTTVRGDQYLQTKPTDWDQAIQEWQRLDDLRTAGRMPWVRHFEVRSEDDPTNPTVYAPTRPRNVRDHPANLRHGYDLKAGQRVTTFQCIHCGRVYQGSGLGVGSHNRHCPYHHGKLWAMWDLETGDMVQGVYS